MAEVCEDTEEDLKLMVIEHVGNVKLLTIFCFEGESEGVVSLNQFCLRLRENAISRSIT